jgi:hypothetical protein
MIGQETMAVVKVRLKPFENKKNVLREIFFYKKDRPPISIGSH